MKSEEKNVVLQDPTPKSLDPEVFGQWRLTLLLVCTLISVGMSGCHPCSLIECGGPTVKAVVFVDGDGDLYIDIPDRKKYTHTEIESIEVSRIKDKIDKKDPMMNRDFFWVIEKPYTPQRTNDFPLRYGEDVLGAIIYTSPKKIENGVYIINGRVIVLGGKGIGGFSLTGDFSYENGVVQNLKRTRSILDF